MNKEQYNYTVCMCNRFSLFFYRQQMIAVLRCKVHDVSVHSIQNGITQTTTYYNRSTCGKY